MMSQSSWYIVGRIFLTSECAQLLCSLCCVENETIKNLCVRVFCAIRNNNIIIIFKRKATGRGSGAGVRVTRQTATDVCVRWRTNARTASSCSAHDVIRRAPTHWLVIIHNNIMIIATSLYGYITTKTYYVLYCYKYLQQYIVLYGRKFLIRIFIFIFNQSPSPAHTYMNTTKSRSNPCKKNRDSLDPVRLGVKAVQQMTINNV